MGTQNVLATVNLAQAEAAFGRVLPAATAIAQSLLVPINLDLPAVVIVGLRVARRLPTFESQLRGLAGFPIDQVLTLHDLVLALHIAQARYLSASTPPEELPELLAKASRWREIMIADVKTLILRGFLSSDALNDFSGSIGYKNVAFDVSGLAQLYKGNWNVLGGKSGLALTEIEEAASLGLTLAEGVASREPETAEGPSAAEIRQRIFTLFYNTYDELRRGMTFLRWHEGDVDSLVPSLYAGRPNRKPTEEDPSDSDDIAELPNPGVPGGEAPSAGVGGSGTPNSTSGHGSTDTGGRVPVGLPGSKPLILG